MELLAALLSLVLRVDTALRLVSYRDISLNSDVDIW